MKHEIDVTIGPDGKATFETRGLTGSICETETSWIDELGTVLEHRRTDGTLPQLPEITNKVNVR